MKIFIRLGTKLLEDWKRKEKNPPTVENWKEKEKVKNSMKTFTKGGLDLDSDVTKAYPLILLPLCEMGTWRKVGQHNQKVTHGKMMTCEA